MPGFVQYHCLSDSGHALQVCTMLAGSPCCGTHCQNQNRVQAIGGFIGAYCLYQKIVRDLSDGTVIPRLVAVAGESSVFIPVRC